MAIPVVQTMDFNLLELLNATAQNLAAAPAHKPGRFYYDSVLGQLGVSNGSIWNYLSTDTGIDTEAAQDIVAAMLAGSTGVTAAYNDTNGTITLTVAANTITNAMVNTAAGITVDKLAETAGIKLLTAAERTKLAGIATAATANATDATLLARASHTGTQSADTIIDGTANKVFLAGEKTKLAGITAGATLNATDAALRDRTTHTGNMSADNITDGATNHAFTNADNTKLVGIATAATANAADAALRDRATHTGTQSADSLTNGTLNKIFLAAEQTKLAGVAAGATANSTDAILKARANHTGTQTAATISDFNAAVNALIAVTVDAAPAALDTLNELAAALGDDPNFATSMTTALGLKANISSLHAIATSGNYNDLNNKPTYTTTIGDAAALSYVVTHNLNSRAIIADVALTATPFTSVLAQVDKTSVNTVTVSFAVAPAAGQYTVTILG